MESFWESVSLGFFKPDGKGGKLQKNFCIGEGFCGALLSYSLGPLSTKGRGPHGS